MGWVRNSTGTVAVVGVQPTLYLCQPFIYVSRTSNLYINKLSDIQTPVNIGTLV